MNFTVRIVSRNLATMSNFVKFRDSRNFTFFEVLRVVRDTWRDLSGSQWATCPAENKSNKEHKWGSHEICVIM